MALVAVAQGEPIGIARLIRDPRRSHEAEIAFEVVDAWQRRGVGRLLLTALAERATDIGVRRVRALVLPANVAAFAVLRSVFPVRFARRDRAFIAAHVPRDFDGAFRQVVRMRLTWSLTEGNMLYPETVALWNHIR